MGEKNIALLLCDSIRLNKLGKTIDHVPPLQFVGYILCDQRLKNCLRKMSKSSFKWAQFMNGFGPNMNNEYESGRLFNDLHGFAELVGFDEEVLKGYAHERAWEAFVLALIKK